MKIMLAGEESAGMQLLRKLLRGPNELVGVLTTAPAPGDTGASLWKVATKAGIPTWPAASVQDSEFARTMRGAAVDLLLNVHSLFLGHAEVLAAAAIGAFNLHPGKLPEYAGLNSASWAIYNEEDEMGVTLHAMDAGIDTGTITDQQMFPIGPTDTALSLNARCTREGLTLLDRLLDTAERNLREIPRIPQDLSRRRYFGRKAPFDAETVWNAPGTRVLTVLRACDYAPFVSPWGHPQARFGRLSFGVLKAAATGAACDVAPGTVEEDVDGGLRIATADEWLKVQFVEQSGTFLDARKIVQPGEAC